MDFRSEDSRLNLMLMEIEEKKTQVGREFIADLVDLSTALPILEDLADLRDAYDVRDLSMVGGIATRAERLLSDRMKRTETIP